MSSNPVTTPFNQQAKAVLGGVLAGLTALGTALADGTVTPVEMVGIAIALIATYGTVFGVSNGRRPVGEGGHVNVIAVAAVTALATSLLVLVLTGKV